MNKLLEKYVGKKIQSAKIENDALEIDFDDGKKIKIQDGYERCCETRYMKCDDDLAFLTGKTFKGIEEKEFRSKFDEVECREHDSQFIEVQTTEGHVTFCTHNEHNGNYGGFDVHVTEEGA